MRGTRPFPKAMTERQKRVWQFYSDFQHDYGYPPSYRDARDQLGYRNIQCVQDNVDALLRKGFLKRLALKRGLSRNIVAVNGDAGNCPTCGQKVGGAK